MSLQFTAPTFEDVLSARDVPDGFGLGLEAVGDGFTDEADFLAMGIDPARPTEAKPGSEDKVLVLAARYAAGLPLWHTDDRCDHAPDRFGGLLAGFGG